jgi:F-type H+-transporting ATPase subunit gamma
VVVAFSSNSSMCGAFNSNVIKRTLSEIRAISASGRQVEAWAFGKKVAEALRKASVPVERDYTSLVSHSEYSAVAAIAQELRALSASGDVDSVLLVYNHFVSTGRQEVVVEPYLGAAQLPDLQEIAQSACTEKDAGYILEPSRGGLLEFLMPQVLDLRLYAALLDSAAAEHAARMIAMQAATDNGESLLAELTLEYNKGRQQKITSEILDLVGGSAQ